MKDYSVLFVTDNNFLPFAFRSIDTFFKTHEKCQVNIVCIDCDEKRLKKLLEKLNESLKTNNHVLKVYEEKSKKGITSKDWAATRRAVYTKQIMIENPEKKGVFYFDVDYVFYKNSADLMFTDAKIYDFMLRSSVRIKKDLASRFQIENSVPNVSDSSFIESRVWINSPRGKLGINSGLIWIRNNDVNKSLLDDWEKRMEKQNYVWFSDQNNLRDIIEENLIKGLINWRPVDFKHYESFYHEKGPKKMSKLNELNKILMS